MQPFRPAQLLAPTAILALLVSPAAAGPVDTASLAAACRAGACSDAVEAELEGASRRRAPGAALDAAVAEIADTLVDLARTTPGLSGNVVAGLETAAATTGNRGLGEALRAAADAVGEGAAREIEPVAVETDAPGAPRFVRPGSGRPGYGRPDYGRPGYGRPDYGRPAYGRPGYGRPGGGRPGGGRPGGGWSGGSRPGGGWSGGGWSGHGGWGDWDPWRPWHPGHPGRPHNPGHGHHGSWS
ncbi:MAG: hypothetical protein H6895_08580 [Defluviimonas sp.]|uniref:hypothetical protein n=1 Tax=Albidovulum sp. TaxID=1872424 RepID=UPI002A2849DD|nr:hypothetical protein [Defluviimonas sp.]